MSVSYTHLQVTRPVVVSVVSEESSSSPEWPVNLNTADLEQLDTCLLYTS